MGLGRGDSGQEGGDSLGKAQGQGDRANEPTSMGMRPVPMVEEAIHNGFLVLEGMDDDSESGESRLSADLYLLAYSSPLFQPALDQFMEARRQERELIQLERRTELEKWRQIIAA